VSREAEIKESIASGVGDGHLPGAAIPEGFGVLAQDFTGCLDSLGASFVETWKLGPVLTLRLCHR
jgi:hypothetical protein